MMLSVNKDSFTSSFPFISSVNKDNFISSFPPCVPFLFLSRCVRYNFQCDVEKHVVRGTSLSYS